jgi:hypothetical protein
VEKPISFRLSLWRATIINIISSAAGSIAAWLFFQEQMIWEMMGGKSRGRAIVTYRKIDKRYLKTPVFQS